MKVKYTRLASVIFGRSMGKALI